MRWYSSHFLPAALTLCLLAENSLALSQSIPPFSYSFASPDRFSCDALLLPEVAGFEPGRPTPAPAIRRSAKELLLRARARAVIFVIAPRQIPDLFALETALWLSLVAPVGAAGAGTSSAFAVFIRVPHTLNPVDENVMRSVYASGGLSSVTEIREDLNTTRAAVINRLRALAHRQWVVLEGDMVTLTTEGRDAVQSWNQYDLQTLRSAKEQAQAEPVAEPAAAPAEKLFLTEAEQDALRQDLGAAKEEHSLTWDQIAEIAGLSTAGLDLLMARDGPRTRTRVKTANKIRQALEQLAAGQTQAAAPRPKGTISARQQRTLLRQLRDAIQRTQSSRRRVARLAGVSVRALELLMGPQGPEGLQRKWIAEGLRRAVALLKAEHGTRLEQANQARAAIFEIDPGAANFASLADLEALGRMADDVAAVWPEAASDAFTWTARLLWRMERKAPEAAFTRAFQDRHDRAGLVRWAHSVSFEEFDQEFGRLRELSLQAQEIPRWREAFASDDRLARRELGGILRFTDRLMERFPTTFGHDEPAFWVMAMWDQLLGAEEPLRNVFREPGRAGWLLRGLLVEEDRTPLARAEGITREAVRQSEEKLLVAIQRFAVQNFSNARRPPNGPRAPIFAPQEQLGMAHAFEEALTRHGLSVEDVETLSGVSRQTLNAFRRHPLRRLEGRTARAVRQAVARLLSMVVIVVPTTRYSAEHQSHRAA